MATNNPRLTARLCGIMSVAALTDDVKDKVIQAWGNHKLIDLAAIEPLDMLEELATILPEPIYNYGDRVEVSAELRRLLSDVGFIDERQLRDASKGVLAGAVNGLVRAAIYDRLDVEGATDVNFNAVIVLDGGKIIGLDIKGVIYVPEGTRMEIIGTDITLEVRSLPWHDLVSIARRVKIIQ